VICARRFTMGIRPGEADAGCTAADTRGFQHGDRRAGLRQAVRYLRTHHAGADHDNIRHCSISPLLDRRALLSAQEGLAHRMTGNQPP
jgi:hypothetical protein